MKKYPEKLFNKGTNKNTIMYLGIELMRILIPPLIVLNPVGVIIIATFLDAIDGDFASQGVTSIENYEKVDKVMDTWFHFWELIYSFFVLNNYIVFLSALFIYRLIGVSLFFKKNNRNMLMFFPNFFENTFFLLLLIQIMNLQKLSSGPIFYFLVIFVFILKLLQEYWVHVLKKSVFEDIFKVKWRKWLPR